MMDKLNQQNISTEIENNIWAEIEKEAHKKNMTMDEYVVWLRKNNPEIDWGDSVGEEII